MDKVFQIAFMIIMTLGILGLPLYYYLNSKKKRFETEDIEEEPENPVGLDSDELENDGIDNDDQVDDDLILDGADYESEEIDFSDKYVYPDTDEEFYDSDNDEADNKANVDNDSENSDENKSDSDESEELNII